jgi:hypothetical protein
MEEGFLRGEVSKDELQQVYEGNFEVGVTGATLYGVGAAYRLYQIGRTAKTLGPQIAKIEKQLLQHGRRSVERSLRSLERSVAEHRQALETYRAQGGFTSFVEREIRAFEAEIQAIKEVLGRTP